MTKYVIDTSVLARYFVHQEQKMMAKKVIQSMELNRSLNEFRAIIRSQKNGQE